MASFLSEILSARRMAVAHAKRSMSGAELEREASLRGRPRDFRGALAAKGMSLIAEMKRASPSRGDLSPDLDPVVLADAYERGGARALSVLTEPEFFKGRPEDVVATRSASQLPTLWKDFVIDPYQVVQARSYGADACLVIVRILTDDALGAVLAEIERCVANGPMVGIKLWVAQRADHAGIDAIVSAAAKANRIRLTGWLRRSLRASAFGAASAVQSPES
jgi:indole-3-glycerol phosphate synthase